jgi:hypothetical protein
LNIDRFKGLLKYPQLLLLYISYYFFKLLVINKTDKWVIGVDEIASTIYFVGNVVKPSITVCLSKNKFYNLKYDFLLNLNNKYLNFIARIIYGPVLLGYLLGKSSKFLYIWHTSFLFDRESEFRFLKKRNNKILCLFVGDDIRSPKLTINYAKEHDIDIHASYTSLTINQDYEEKKKKIAQIADKYSDVIFNAKIDQIAYLKNKQYGWPYIYDIEKFNKNTDKFKDIKKIKILHSPSNPISKGTQLVRSAIKKLKLEKYNIEYIELINVSNETVLGHLKSSHIVLNQFYAFAPGLFGIESMANHCAVLMSADPSVETTLPQDSKDAWMITRYWELHDNLKYLLDNPEKIKYYADNGYDFTYKHYTCEAASEYINKVFKENGIID